MLEGKFLVHRMRHLPREYFSSLVTLLDSSLQHNIFFLHTIHIVFENHDITVSLVHLFTLEVHLELCLLKLFDNFLLSVGSSSVLSMQLPF